MGKIFKIGVLIILLLLINVHSFGAMKKLAQVGFKGLIMPVRQEKQEWGMRWYLFMLERTLYSGFLLR